MSTVGIAGAGRMGTAFARRLIETGHTVLVWNRTPARTADAAKAGAGVVSSLAALAAADTILISLTDARAVEAVVDGLLAAGISGRLVVDMSTMLPDQTRPIAVLLSADGKIKEIQDAPARL